MFFVPRHNRFNFGNDSDYAPRSGSRIKKGLKNNINVHLGIRLNILSYPLSQLFFFEIVYTLISSNAAITLRIMKRT